MVVPAVAFLLGASGAARAQVPVTSLGLGYPTPAIDARAAALGGTGLGLFGGTFSSRSPADLVLFPSAGIGATLAPESVDVNGPGGAQSTGRSRLAVLRAVLPVRSWAFGLGFGAALDLDWQVVLSDTLESSFGTFPFSEQREHDGGLSSVDFGVARRLGPFSLGAEFGVLTGTLRQTFTRNFEADIDDPGNTIGVSVGEAVWNLDAWRVRGGVNAALGDVGLLSAVLTWTADMGAERTLQTSLGTRRTFAMPISLEVGGSARVTDRLSVTAAGGYRGWGDTDVSGLGFRSADVKWLGGGVEYLGFRPLGLPLALRLGYRFTDLPFYQEGFSQLTETAVTFGAGVSVAGGRALFDLGFESGSRGDLATTGVEESFGRLSLSLALLQR